ncbi:MAG: hypothetical protein WCF90_10355 [Methanomicrobiales archaeon]
MEETGNKKKDLLTIKAHRFYRFESGNKPVVEDSEELRAICKKYCSNYQNYRKYSLKKFEPTKYSVRAASRLPRT